MPFFYFIGNAVLRQRAKVRSYKAKNAPPDAHSRDWKMSHATALGARVRERTLCMDILWQKNKTERKEEGLFCYFQRLVLFTIF